jgi:hypothetical protein
MVGDLSANNFICFVLCTFCAFFSTHIKAVIKRVVIAILCPAIRL